MLSSTFMRSFALNFLLCISTVHGAVLSSRASTAPVCVGLSVKSNNGDRKVALVIDSSGSMLETDPQNLRLAAGRALNEWLITKAEATGGKKADLVTVIDFDSTATLDYPLGDPGGANSSFSKIDSFGGTFIAGGVQMGIAQITSASSGPTSGRSSIIVFTDGEVRFISLY
jgi:Mg-chelatase subunit ChlD